MIAAIATVTAIANATVFAHVIASGQRRADRIHCYNLGESNLNLHHDILLVLFLERPGLQGNTGTGWPGDESSLSPQ